MTVSVKSKSKSIKSDQYDTTSVDQLIKEISKKNHLNSNRIRLTSLDKSKVIKTDSDLLNEPEILAKDLGPQISWRLVYLIEYFGPLLIHYVLYNYVFTSNHDDSNKLIYTLNIINYVKREVETLFVHRFANSTMPLRNVFKNSGHYWILGGSVGLTYGGIGDLPISLNINKDYVLYIWIFSEFFNAISHIQLRLLGDKSIRQGKPRQAPKGGFFEIFISPNYTFEIFAWISVFLLKPNAFTLIFVIVGAVQMYLWAQKKNRLYKTRKAFLIPFIF